MSKRAEVCSPKIYPAILPQSPFHMAPFAGPRQGESGTTCTSFVLLPHGVVSYIYGVRAKNDSDETAFVTSAKDRLRRLAVCKAWRAELAGSPLPILLVEGPVLRGEREESCAALEWATLSCPPIQQLVVEVKGFRRAKDSLAYSLTTYDFASIHSEPWYTGWKARVNQITYDLLRSLQNPELDGRCSQQLQELHILSVPFHHPPHPPGPAMPVASFNDLRKLTVWLSNHHDTIASWLQELGSLQHLQALDLTLEHAASSPAPQAQLQLPALPALTQLNLSLCLSFRSPVLPLCALRICLANVPLLSLLEVSGYGTVDLAGDPGQVASTTGLGSSSGSSSSSSSAGKLVWAKLAVTHLTADFALMPALAHLEVTIQVWELGGAASIAAATALTQLRLFESYRLPDEDPDEEHATWPLELLRSLPSSLRVLSVPSWSSELAEAVGGLTQLRALSMAYHGEEPMIPSVEAPLWPFLQALHIPTQTVPQELRHASQLQYLSFWPSHMSVDALSLLAVLPALCHVRTQTAELGPKVEATIRKALWRAVPWLHSNRTVDLETDEFFSEALALLS